MYEWLDKSPFRQCKCETVTISKFCNASDVLKLSDVVSSLPAVNQD